MTDVSERCIIDKVSNIKHHFTDKVTRTFCLTVTIRRGLFHLKVLGGGRTEGFLGGGGGGANSALIYPIRLHMISGSRGVSNF